MREVPASLKCLSPTDVAFMLYYKFNIQVDILFSKVYQLENKTEDLSPKFLMPKISKGTEQGHCSAVRVIREFKLLDKQKPLTKHLEFLTVAVSPVNAKVIL